MRNKKMKKLLLGSLLAMTLLAGCGEKKEGENELSIGINQFAEHPALDSVRQGFEDELEGWEKEVKLDFKSAQGDFSNARMISEKFSKDGKKLVFAIGTPSAQSSKDLNEDLPILFSAVTDPLDAGLVKDLEEPGTSLSGTTDESPIKEQLSLFKNFENIKTIGIIYNTAEANAGVQIDKARQAAQELDMEIEAVGISNINDIGQALDSLVKKVDGIYTITDNMVASAINLVAEKALDAQLPTVGAEEAHVRGGILITDGLSYYDLGRQTGKMAKRILLEGEDISKMPVEKAENTQKVFNAKTWESLNLKTDDNLLKDAKEVK